MAQLGPAMAAAPRPVPPPAPRPRATTPARWRPPPRRQTAVAPVGTRLQQQQRPMMASSGALVAATLPRVLRDRDHGALDKSQFRLFVQFFRQASPYIEGHRGRTFVLAIPGEVVNQKDVLHALLEDVALLHGEWPTPAPATCLHLLLHPRPPSSGCGPHCRRVGRQAGDCNWSAAADQPGNAGDRGGTAIRARLPCHGCCFAAGCHSCSRARPHGGRVAVVQGACKLHFALRSTR